MDRFYAYPQKMFGLFFITTWHMHAMVLLFRLRTAHWGRLCNAFMPLLQSRQTLYFVIIPAFSHSSTSSCASFKATSRGRGVFSSIS